jgi:putative membrane protein
MLLMRFIVNLAALTITLLLVPKINLVDRSLATWLWLALMLGLLNTFIKPIIQVLTLRFIFATTGLIVILINAFILLLLSWLFPQYLQANFLWALVAGAVLGLSATFLESLFGLTPPIVSEKYPEIRQRVKDRQFYKTQKELARIEAHKAGVTPQLATAQAIVTAAKGSVALSVAQRGAPAPVRAAVADEEPVLPVDTNKAEVAKPETAAAAPEADPATSAVAASSQES